MRRAIPDANTIWAFREALPYNDTGKLLRRQLKAEMAGAASGLARV